MKYLATMLALLGMLALAMPMVGCEEQGPAESAGEAVDDAIDDAGDAIDDAIDG